jgi:hypothetical protein
MLTTVDIKLIGVFGVVIVLILGYFVYTLYQDLVFVKKDISSIKDNIQEDEDDNHSWCSRDHEHGESELEELSYEEDLEQENELNKHLASFMNQQELQGIPDIELKIEEIQEQVVIKPETKKKYKGKKKVEFAEPPVELEAVNVNEL